MLNRVRLIILLMSAMIALTRPLIVLTGAVFVFIGWLSLSLLATFVIKNNKLLEFFVAEFTVCVVITSAQDGFNIFSSWEEAVSLEVGDEVWHGNNVVSFGNRFESAYFLKVRVNSKLSLGIVPGAMQSHFLVQKP